ncbi:cuticle protein 19-like, partial [Condylostylus longicornis]|uniref:cuticle protein 19-like n=1 Tax=Condylostylus longicornis TaxID=2530218 RepID=UPI00244DC327
ISFMILIVLAVVENTQGHDDHHSHPAYKFDYGVKDPHTGDMKQQWETRDGHNVKGAYELKEADGTKRVVEYHADKHGGFHAHVKRIGHADHPAPKHHGHQGHGHGHASSYANVHLHH